MLTWRKSLGNSCVAIFSNMRATKQARIFGYPEYGGVEVELPLVLESGEKALFVSSQILKQHTSDSLFPFFDSRWKRSGKHRH